MHVALRIHLGLFPVVGGRERDRAEYPRADSLGDRFYGAAFTGGIAPFKYDDNALAGILDPLLYRHQLGLKLA